MKNLRKNADAQHLLPSHVEWYRTRTFWLSVIAIQAIVNLVTLSNYLTASQTFIGKVYATLGILGATTPGIIVGFLSNNDEASNHITVALFLIISYLLLTKTFRRKTVNIIYPLIFVSMSIVSFVILGTLSSI